MPNNDISIMKYTDDYNSFIASERIMSSVSQIVRDLHISIPDISLSTISSYEDMVISTLPPDKSFLFDRANFSFALSKLICDFYGCQRWEFHDLSHLRNQYGIPDSSIEFVSTYGNISEALFQHSIAIRGDGTGQNPKDCDEATLYDKQVIANVDSSVFSSQHDSYIKSTIGKLTMQLLDVTDDKEKLEIETSISKLKLILSKNKQ